MKILAIFIILSGLLWLGFFKTTEIILPAGVMAPKEPQQVMLKSAPVISHDNYILTPLASFDLSAKVLSRKNYRLGREADIAPVDLALGWGRMSDQSVISELDISQANRWYYWRSTNQPPIPLNEIVVSSANMHIIPATEAVKYQLKQVRQGDIVSIKGHLVRADAKDNSWHWTSSLTRDDTGGGACELVLVEYIMVTTSQ